MKIKKKKVNKYERQIEAVLDLHGFYQKEAEPALNEYLNSSVAKGMKRIKIITGKGIHSAGGVGIIKELSMEVLKTRGFRFRDAKLNEGGSGALVVDLQ